MDEQLKEQLTEVLGAANGAKDFAIEQLPLVAQEFIAWEFWGSVGMATISGVIALLALVASVLLWRKANEYDRKGDSAAEGISLLFFVAAFAFIGASLCSLIDTYHAARVSVAPRVVLIEKLSELVK